MTRQKHPNPLKDPELPARFARLLAKYMIRSRISDEQLGHKMNEVAGASGSLATIRRHKDGTGGTPSYRMIGIYQHALGIPENEIDVLIDPDRAVSATGAPSFSDFNEQWTELVEYLQRQSQLPHHIQNERARARVAFKERNYDKAREHLEKVSEWTRNSYREHEISFAYATEEYGRALASLGALAFTSMDFAEARVQYLKALALVNLSTDNLDSYRRSYLISSSALAAKSKSEAEARAILKEMADAGVAPDVVSYSSLLNFVKSEAEARAILKEMADAGVAPNVVSYSSLLNFVKSEAEARAILKEMADAGVAPNVVSYNSLLNFVKSEAEARAILKEMADAGVAPNVVSYNSLLNFVKSEAEARAILKEMVDAGVAPDVVSYSSLLNFVKSEAEARAILKEMADAGVAPNVVSYSSLLNFVKSEAEARAILKEMADAGVAPNVVSYNSLLNFVKSEAEARAILKEMADAGVAPNEITVISAITRTETFEGALGLIDFCLSKNLFVGRGAFEAAFSKSITHLTAEQLLAEHHARKFKFDTALEGPLNQYRRAHRADQALMLTLIAPHVGAAQKLYREMYDLCRGFFQAELAAGNDEDNIYYALGIAAALNDDWEIAAPNLKVALERAYASKRADHIKNLLAVSPQSRHSFETPA